MHSRTLRSRAARAGLGALLLFGLLAPGTALGGGSVHQSGKVTKVWDGDTVTVDLNGDGDGDREVRLIGIDTPEMTSCGGPAAKKALTSLLDGKHVDLWADDSDTTDVKNRLPRRITVVRDGTTIDATHWLLKRGWGPWKPRDTETSHALDYHTTADTAAAQGLRYFDDDRCKPGPQQSDTLKLFAQWQADVRNGQALLNQEFARVRNLGPDPIDVDGWRIRMGSHRDLFVPAGKPIASGATLTIHVGSGNNRRYHRYLRQDHFLLNNPTDSGVPHIGNGVYLLDRDGDLRAWQTYPCTLSCNDPTGGALVIADVNFDANGPDNENVNGEWVLLENRGDTPVHTGNLVIENSPIYYELPPSHWLAPGETLKVHVGHGTQSHDERYMGWDTSVMGNDGDRVLVRTYDNIIIDCVDWGTGRCP